MNSFNDRKIAHLRVLDGGADSGAELEVGGEGHRLADGKSGTLQGILLYVAGGATPPLAVRHPRLPVHQDLAAHALYPGTFERGKIFISCKYIGLRLYCEGKDCFILWICRVAFGKCLYV